jgi:hypothetical protein
MQKYILAAVILLYSFNSMANMPENSLPDDNPGLSNITEKQFHEIIQSVNDIYQPIFKALNVNFWFERHWESKVSNLYVYKFDSQWAKNWKIEVNGALARRVEITKEGFTLALCHEIGHFLGGFPMRDYVGLSTEGQADYYAAHVCARKIFGKIAKKTKLIKKLKVSVGICDNKFDSQIEKDICYYTIFGAKSLADFFYIAAQERRTPEIDTKDLFQIKTTQQLHSPAQCRLDTFVSGTLCDKQWDDKLIPTDKKNKTCDRPRCWFAY